MRLVKIRRRIIVTATVLMIVVYIKLSDGEFPGNCGRDTPIQDHKVLKKNVMMIMYNHLMVP